MSPGSRRRGWAGRARLRSGFTLLELMLVMGVIGVLLGMVSLGLERLDPGARGLREALSTFIESSRDRARATGFPVVLEVVPPEEEDGRARVARYTFRPVLEAGFEAPFLEAQGVNLIDPARVGPPGRCGACLELADGGAAFVEGRGGKLTLDMGFAVELDLQADAGENATLLDWEGLLDLRARNDGRLILRIEGAPEELGTTRTLETPTGTIIPGRWHHLRLAVDEGRASIRADGRLLAEMPFAARLPRPARAPQLGDPDGRFRGRLDEFVVYARVREIGPELRDGVEVLFDPARVVLDRYGLLDAAVHAAPVGVEIREYGESTGSITIGRFAEEEAL